MGIKEPVFLLSSTEPVYPQRPKAARSSGCRRNPVSSAASLDRRVLYLGNKKGGQKEYLKAYYLANCDKLKKYKKVWYLLNCENVNKKSKAWRLGNSEAKQGYDSNWRLKNSERMKELQKKWRLTNHEKEKEYNRRYRKTLKGKLAGRKTKATRRALGFVPLNKPFPESHGHHIDTERVIYMPIKPHQSVWHSLSKNINMDKINSLAWGYLRQERTLAVAFILGLGK